MTGTFRTGKIVLNIFLFLFFVVSTVSAQNKTVTGTVKDTDGNTLPGVTVVEKGTTNGVSTNMDGKFSLTLQGNKPVLVFSSIGFTTIEKSVTGWQHDLQIVMTEDAVVLSDVVVVGYGTVKEARLPMPYHR